MLDMHSDNDVLKVKFYVLLGINLDLFGACRQRYNHENFVLSSLSPDFLFSVNDKFITHLTVGKQIF